MVPISISMSIYGCWYGNPDYPDSQVNSRPGPGFPIIKSAAKDVRLNLGLKYSFEYLFDDGKSFTAQV